MNAKEKPTIIDVTVEIEHSPEYLRERDKRNKRRYYVRSIITIIGFVALILGCVYAHPYFDYLGKGKATIAAQYLIKSCISFTVFFTVVLWWYVYPFHHEEEEWFEELKKEKAKKRERQRIIDEEIKKALRS